MVNQFSTKVSRKLNGERIVLPINGAGTTGYSHAKKEGDPYLTPHTRINSKMDQGPKWRRKKTIKFLEENIGAYPGLGNGF